MGAVGVLRRIPVQIQHQLDGRILLQILLGGFPGIIVGVKIIVFVKLT